MPDFSGTGPPADKMQALLRQALGLQNPPPEAKITNQAAYVEEETEVSVDSGKAAPVDPRIEAWDVYPDEDLIATLEANKLSSIGRDRTQMITDLLTHNIEPRF